MLIHVFVSMHECDCVCTCIFMVVGDRDRAGESENSSFSSSLLLDSYHNANHGDPHYTAIGVPIRSKSKLAIASPIASPRPLKTQLPCY